LYRIAVCDDNPEILTQVCTTLSGSPLGKELELTPFHSGAALAAALRSGAIGRLLREELRDSVTQLLYISGQQQYAMALFDTRPLNFLLKPLDEAKLLNCVVQAIRLSRPEEAVLTVLVERTPRALPTQAIRYIESYHKRITVHSVQHELVCRDKLDTVARQLPEQFFLRIHQSFLVNTLYVRRIQYDRLTLDDGTELPISQSYRRVVRGRLLRWTPGGMVL
jgi:two-component system LytT family response regulator